MATVWRRVRVKVNLRDVVPSKLMKIISALKTDEKPLKKSPAAGQSPKSLNIMKLPSFAPTYPSKGELPFKTEIPLIISLLIVLPSVMGLILDVS